MTKYYLLFLIFLFLSCSVKQVGKVNMISNRNIDTSYDYKLISSYEGGAKKEMKRSKAETIEDAIDQTVRKVPGGEYLMNVKIYLINNHYFAVSGDVWGKTEDISFRGFRTGDRVTWRNSGLIPYLGNEDKFLFGVIKSLKNDEECIVNVENTDQVVELKYQEISKIEHWKINDEQPRNAKPLKAGDLVFYTDTRNRKIEAVIIETIPPNSAIIEYRLILDKKQKEVSIDSLERRQ